MARRRGRDLRDRGRADRAARAAEIASSAASSLARHVKNREAAQLSAMDHLALPTRALISHLRIHFSTIADYVPDADDLQSVAPDLTEVARMYMAEMHACALALVEEERAVAAKGVAEAAIPAGDAAPRRHRRRPRPDLERPPPAG